MHEVKHVDRKLCKCTDSLSCDLQMRSDLFIEFIILSRRILSLLSMNHNC